MRLSSLKLSGFKSFADQTTLKFKANRSAIVGPNGCGKSNVIDAVRWVMGESSARQLRGGSMQDVIFTGTAKRKPVGVASVELRFDNTYGKLGGEYNAYTELAVRRQVTREGKSEYFLNGTRCRRRDITDIFLGTGLGPRSYAVIEQGMINRLIDAKPDDMRVFIEEAAGISRYQSRRKETLQHLEQTTQNLSRLEDIESELKAQLKTLKRQSESAVRYQQLEKEILTIKVEILSFQYEKSTKLQQEYSLQMDELGERFKQTRSELSTVEHNLNDVGQIFQQLVRNASPLQQEWQIADNKKQSIHMLLQQKTQLLDQNQQQFSLLTQQKDDLKQKVKLIDIQLDDLYTQKEDLQQKVIEAENELVQKRASVEHVNIAYKEKRKISETLYQSFEKQKQKNETLKSQLEQLIKNIQRGQQQKEILLAQSDKLKKENDDGVLQDLQQEYQDLLASIELTEKILTDDQYKLKQFEQKYDEAKINYDNTYSQISALRQEKQNLEKLQVKKTSSRSKGKNQQLIHVLQLTAQAKPYANLIEKFLAQWLMADILVDGHELRTDVARQLIPNEREVVSDLVLNLPTLSSWIKVPVLSLYRDVGLIDTLKNGLQLQHQLQQGQSILTLDGYWIGSDWIVALFYDDGSKIEGVLSHQVRLEEITIALEQLEKTHQTHELLLSEFKDQCIQQKHIIEAQQVQLKQQHHQAQDANIAIIKTQSQKQAYISHCQQLESQLKQLDFQLEEDEMQKDDIDIDLHAVQMKLDDLQSEYNQAQNLFLTSENDAETLISQIKLLEDKHREVNNQFNRCQQDISLLEKDDSFFKLQLQQLQTQIVHLDTLIAPLDGEIPVLQQQYEAQTIIVAQLQKQLSTWQNELNSIQEKQQGLTEKRHQLEVDDQQIRDLLEEKRLAWHTVKSDLDHYHEQRKDLNVDYLKNIHIDVSAHQEKLIKLQAQFSKLGAVNLVASAEYEDVKQRHEALVHQMSDLENTTQQLHAAMKSIDQETKKLFMQTFDKINAELKVLFPKVFSGGEASLSLEDDWQSGVKLMARPPGKRNSSLALLSGGEKALTALSLVFAIFRLNPAPFCVLDEVDAPLDDANVARFCNLVKELSEQVQFIYITHNKLAMTMATDLLGVTMPEPGTSKLVTVNLEEAKEYGLVAES
ncbi:chromosome segregation protein SMC [Acinetobacter pollinis]|uniref:chromosome segregation protein SMC n=1 Tax=Acinetobacter pollinis TaxID=2605270 RepID=UPI0018A2C509|nr:chromosome segregation protein SMC [Acinetobacter pollinis]MBF7690803.1 chromosome segregation protein SMC [Acinetobacter pollinis]MBF7692596.1 chromosome segregation protein SMC [Acinetobacter pollinis]MBF7698405.1 chromosome segregation protein SMC [Acinetobacter pollinis]MBF7699588.1 chromosome segregation protein SMC [Acinetobacter pollinis]